jgi:hypothetical protein
MNTIQIYGICWNIYDDQGIPLVRYMKKFPHQMTSDEIHETLSDFNKLTDKQKEHAFFRFYAPCRSSNYDCNFEPYRTWFTTNVNEIEHFLITNARQVQKTRVAKKNVGFFCG